MNPRVSIITGYYNRSHALKITIDSIMNQSYEDFEFIIFNDCSTDDTRDVLDSIVNEYNDPRIKVINHEKNIGFVQGMINAIELSNGEYICVQGSGDYSYPERVKMQVDLLDHRLDVGVVGSYYENYVESTGISRVRYKDASKINFDSLLKNNIFSHGEVMYRKGIYDKVGGYRKEFVNCQDYDLWLRMIQVSKLANVEELLYRRYVRYDGVSYDPNQFIKQVRYGHVARRLSVSNEDDNLLNEISNKGILNVVPNKDIQGRIIKGILRSLIWEEREHAERLIKIGVSNAFIKSLLLFFSGVYNFNMSKPLRSVVKSLLKVDD